MIFAVGQRVRLSEKGRATFSRWRKSTDTGTVIEVISDDLIIVRRDGIKDDPHAYAVFFWEPIG